MVALCRKHWPQAYGAFLGTVVAVAVGKKVGNVTVVFASSTVMMVDVEIPRLEPLAVRMVSVTVALTARSLVHCPKILKATLTCLFHSFHDFFQICYCFSSHCQISLGSKVSRARTASHVQES